MRNRRLRCLCHGLNLPSTVCCSSLPPGIGTLDVPVHPCFSDPCGHLSTRHTMNNCDLRYGSPRYELCQADGWASLIWFTVCLAQKRTDEGVHPHILSPRLHQDATPVGSLVPRLGPSAAQGARNHRALAYGLIERRVWTLQRDTAHVSSSLHLRSSSCWDVHPRAEGELDVYLAGAVGAVGAVGADITSPWISSVFGQIVATEVKLDRVPLPRQYASASTGSQM